MTRDVDALRTVREDGKQNRLPLPEFFLPRSRGEPKAVNTFVLCGVYFWGMQEVRESKKYMHLKILKGTKFITIFQTRTSG